MQVLQDMIGDLSNEPEPVVIKMYSQDPQVLLQAAPRVAEAIGKVAGVVDVLDGVENSISGPASTFQINSATAARSGFTPEEVAVDASALLEGEPAATPVILNDRVYPIRVRFPDASRASLDQMMNTPLLSGTGKTATLGALASLSSDPGQTEIRRENLQRLMQVTARLEEWAWAPESPRSEGGRWSAFAIVDPRGIWRYIPGAAEIISRFVEGLVLALLLLFAVLLFGFRTFSAPAAILASAILSIRRDVCPAGYANNV